MNANLSAVTTWSPAGLVTGKTCLVHDALNRLIAVGPALALESPGNVACKTEADLASVTVRFKYDARNRRVARQDGTGPWKQWALLPDGSPLTEFWKPATSTGDWEKLREYVWLEGKPLAQVEYPGPTAAEGYVYSVHTDHLGLPRALTNSTGAVVWTAAPTRPYGDVAEVTTPDPANGRTVATNLRLPGQYDERLLADIDIQGPYYNWNRWYLPGMGRYMELDPAAIAGGFNEEYGPAWYTYAEGDPLRHTDRFGLDAEMCYRRFSPAIIVPYARHCYVRFNGNDKDTMSFDPSGVGPDGGFKFLSRTCTKTSGTQNDACVKREMKRCQADQWDFTGFNCCHCVEQALNACGLSIPVSGWPNWPVNPGPQPGEPGSCSAGPPSNGCTERK